MDASGYLRKHGWRGQGHSLDHTDRGIKKPLLISKKIDVLGVGLNKHAAVSDQWWLRAFDAGLKSFGTGAETSLSQVHKYGHRRSGLYDRFVRGAPIPGSIGESARSTQTTSQGKAIRLWQEDPRPHDGDSSGPDQGLASSGADKRSKSSETKAAAERKRKRKRDEGLNPEDKSCQMADEPVSSTSSHINGAEKDTTSAVSVEAKSADLSGENQRIYTRRAARQGVSLQDYLTRRGKAAPSHITFNDLSPSKQKLYTARAANKQLSLRDYLTRRANKTARKSAT